jgi:IS5 family transposase
MRLKFIVQSKLEFGPSLLQVTQDYYAKYEAINDILLATPAILDAFHKDASTPLRRARRRRAAPFTSDQLLRAILVMEIEELTFRATVIRIDDSQFLRRFVGLHDQPTMDFTTLNKVYKAIGPKTWKRINGLLAQYARSQGHICGESLRVDTTAYETNVHYPTDSSLLEDGYRVLARLIERVRSLDGEVVGSRRLQVRKVKRTAQQIARLGVRNETNRRKQRRLYKVLLGRVEAILAWSHDVRTACQVRQEADHSDPMTSLALSGLLEEMQRFEELTHRVVDQTRRRVLDGEVVPNTEKLFSLFEPHTELLIRGKAGKTVEFGHMVLLQQVENLFISGYEVFEKRPSDESLVDQILRGHQGTFGHLPTNFTADKGFYKSREQLADLRETIPNVSIAKKGSRTLEEMKQEHDPIFRTLQRFRAGIEGTISYLKRCYKMFRCLYRSFTTFRGSVGCHVFAHNLIVLARL